jgi:hypothetical protein
MEILVRWSCDCTAPRWACINCKGKGIVERWIPAELVQLFRRRAFIILDSRLPSIPTDVKEAAVSYS